MATKRKTNSPFDEGDQKLPKFCDSDPSDGAHTKLPSLSDALGASAFSALSNLSTVSAPVPSIVSTPGPLTVSAPVPSIVSTPGPLTVSAPVPSIVSTPGPSIVSTPGPLSTPGLLTASNVSEPWIFIPHVDVHKYGFEHVFDHSKFQAVLGQGLLKALNKTREPGDLELSSPVMYGSLGQACMRSMLMEGDKPNEDMESKALSAALNTIMRKIYSLEEVVDMYINHPRERMLLYMANASYALIHRKTGIVGEEFKGQEWIKARLLRIKTQEYGQHGLLAVFQFSLEDCTRKSLATFSWKNLLELVKRDTERLNTVLGIVATASSE